MRRLLPILSLAFTGCFGVVASDQFTYRGPVAVPEGVLRLDGYYFSENTREPYDGDSTAVHHTGTVITPLVFWEDGTAAFFYINIGRAVEYRRFKPSRYGTLSQAQEKFEGRVDSLLSGERSDPAHWGAFRLEGDSVSIQVLHWGMSGRPGQYFPVEYNGLVLNDTTLVLTEVIDSVSHTLGRAGAHPMRDTLRFKRHTPLPGSANWTQAHPKLTPRERP